MKSCCRKVKSALGAGEIFRFQRKVKVEICPGANFIYLTERETLLLFSPDDSNTSRLYYDCVDAFGQTDNGCVNVRVRSYENESCRYVCA